MANDMTINKHIDDTMQTNYQPIREQDAIVPQNQIESPDLEKRNETKESEGELGSPTSPDDSGVAASGEVDDDLDRDLVIDEDAVFADSDEIGDGKSNGHVVDGQADDVIDDGVGADEADEEQLLDDEFLLNNMHATKIYSPVMSKPFQKVDSPKVVSSKNFFRPCESVEEANTLRNDIGEEILGKALDDCTADNETMEDSASMVDAASMVERKHVRSMTPLENGCDWENEEAIDAFEVNGDPRSQELSLPPNANKNLFGGQKRKLKSLDAIVRKISRQTSEVKEEANMKEEEEQDDKQQLRERLKERLKVSSSSSSSIHFPLTSIYICMYGIKLKKERGSRTIGTGVSQKNL